MCDIYSHSGIFSPPLYVVDVCYLLPSIKCWIQLLLEKQYKSTASSRVNTLHIVEQIQLHVSSSIAFLPSSKRQYIFSSVICEDYYFGLLLSPCFSEDLVWISFCIKFLWGLQSYIGTCSCDFSTKLSFWRYVISDAFPNVKLLWRSFDVRYWYKNVSIVWRLRTLTYASLSCSIQELG